MLGLLTSKSKQNKHNTSFLKATGELLKEHSRSKVIRRINYSTGIETVYVSKARSPVVKYVNWYRLSAGIKMKNQPSIPQK